MWPLGDGVRGYVTKANTARKRDPCWSGRKGREVEKGQGLSEACWGEKGWAGDWQGEENGHHVDAELLTRIRSSSD